VTRKRRTQETRERLAQELKAKYYAGASVRGLAAEYECAYGTAHGLLTLAGTRFRPRGGGRPYAVSAEQQAGGRS